MDRQQFSAPSVLGDCKDIELTNGQERGHDVQRVMYSDTMELVEPMVVVKNGLKLQRQATGIPEDYGSYSYALSPLTVAPKGIDWKIIVPSGADIVCDHIHCHEVKPDDNLDELIAKCRANCAVAVVLVNCNDNYFLPDTIQSCFTKTDYPVLVVTANDGKKLLQTLQEEDDDGDFQAKVLDKEPAERVPDISKWVELQPYSATYRKAVDGGKRIDIYKHFRKQLKQFLHHSGHVTCVSEDPEQFKQVVAAFDVYEQQLHSMEVFSNPASHQCICDDLNKWRDKCELGKEFPIYLVLANMLLRSRSLYACTGFDGFVNRTVQKIEKLPWHAVATTVQAFVGRGNFEVALSNTTISVFKLLENICSIILRDRSLKPHYIKMKSGEKVQKTPIAAKMFWISLTVKFSSHGESQEPVGLLWRDYIITTYYNCFVEVGSVMIINSSALLSIPTDCEHLTLTDDVIAAVERGLEFGKQLQLPPEVSFSTLHISQFLAQPTYFVRPFKHIRTFLQRVNLMNYLYAESDLEHFMEVLHENYSSWINECSEDLVSWLSTERSLHEAISEGVAFLGELHTLMDKKQWTSKELAHKFQQWLKLLIELIDMKNPEAAQCLKLFLDYKNCVCKEHKKTTRTHVKNLVKANFQEITMKQFYSLYKVFYRQWEITFLQEYLTKYKFQDGERITQVWSEFFQEVVKNYTSPQDHQFLVEFLKRTGQFYAVSYTHFEFLVDLLAIEVPQLFAHEQSGSDLYSEFSAFLQDYVSGWHIEERVPLILERLSTVKSQSPFMDLIITVMMQNFFQKDVTTLLLPLRSVVIKLTANNRLEIKMTSSPLEVFCWRFLAGFCSEIQFQAGPNWIEIRLLQPAILELGTVCECYCTTKNWSEKECLRAICESKSLPEDISGSLNETVKYFEWVKSAQGVLNRWHTQLAGHTVNYDEILHYQHQKPFFQELSQRLCTPCLVLDESKPKQHFEKRFEELHVLLLRYIGNEPDGKWCTLIELLRQLGIMIPTHIQDALDKYIQFPYERGKKHNPFLQNTIPLSVTSKFLLTEKGLPLALKATTGLTLKRLDELVHYLNQFLRPLSTYLDMLIFFTLQESRMFVTYVRYELKRDNRVGDKVQQASKALESTSLLIWDIVNGKAKYRDIVAGRTLNLETLNIDKELHILRSWVTSENPDKVLPDFFTPVKAQLQLSKFATNSDAISKVCTNYDLQGCLKDSQLRQLVDLVAKLKDDVTRDEISLEDAKWHKMEVERALYLQTDSDYKCLDLFPAIADSKDFFTFVQKRQFIGRAGQTQFQRFLELITAQLQHDSDEYEQTVLNSLLAAFQLIAPFTDKSQTFSELMLKVVKLDVSHGLVQLETVKNNLHLIDLWISRAEGDTLQNALTDLENVLQTGFFKFLVEESGIYTPPRLVLEYNPFAHKAKEFANSGRVQLEKTSVVQEASKERPCSTSHTKTWDSGEISSFVQMLGLLDQEKTHHSEKITRFQRLNEIAEKLLGLFTKLKELGHPDYLHTTSPAKILACSDDDQIVEKKVEEAQNSLNVWKHQIEEWNKQYPHLLFFTIPKVLRLHQSLLKMPHVVESAVANDIAFLFRTDKPAQVQLRHSIKKVLEKELPSCLMPMPRVGEFLKSLLNDVELTTFCTPKRYLKGTIQHTPTSNLSWSSAYRFIILVELHYTPGFDKTQLLSMIFGIYQGVPESFEFFHCSSDTTELDLKRFVERIWKHARTYMMFGVNNLSLHLQEVLVQHFEIQQALAETSVESTLHCVEMSPSSLREIPWIQLKEHQTTDPLVSVENATTIGRERLLHHTDIEAVHLVYGQPGDGKTHFVKRTLQEKLEYPSVTITVNEGFTTTGAILELNSLTEEAKSPIVFFNFTFTLLPSDYKGCEPKERENYKILIDSISWFFFDLLVLGYAEDRNSGLSFRLPGDLSWTIYVEVPCSCWPEDISDDSNTCLKKSLAHFQSEIPVLGLLGTPHLIDHQKPLFVDEDVQLVCKYLRAYHDRTLLWINRLYVQTAGIMRKKKGKPVKFSTDKDIPQAECNELLLNEMSKQIKKSKIIQKLYIRYMHRRCKFLDNFPAFNYNMGRSVPGAEDTSRLGSTLMRAMLKEVADFCNPEILKNWSCKPHQQLIYGYRGGGAIGYISLNTENLLKDDVDKLKRIGVQIPTQADLHSREYLDECLSRALNLPLEKQEDGQKRLPLIDESGYVLTLDYTIKMLSIHERRECRMPVIIEGETGVGKSALVEMLSKLWNASWTNVQRKNKEHILTFLRKILQDQEKLASDNDSYKACRVELTKMIATAEVREDVLDNILKLPDAKNPQVELFQVVREYLLEEIRSVCPVEMLRPLKNHKEVKFLFKSVSQEVCKETTLELLYALLTPELKQTFYKLQVHAALQLKDIWQFFDGVILQAESLQNVFSTNTSDEGQHSLGAPIVTVFLDELNTSICGGVFKEIIVDRTMNSKEIPFNVFIIAACNPHRGNSLAPSSPDETWVRGSYYVHRLHPTLRYLMWDYGSLDELQERRYIEAKIKLLHSNLPSTKVDALTHPIVRSQNLMRKYAWQQLLECSLPTLDAEAASKSTVSQRDIQRFFTFYQWFLKMYDTLHRHEGKEQKTRAMLVALSLVYYMRLNSKYRKMYKHEMEKEMEANMQVNICFEQVYQSELEWLISKIHLPTGIARTQGLKENLFAIITCTMTHTPLILVGAPGSSKTLSFYLVAENLRGKESDVDEFQRTELFSAIDPLFYQCSRQTTSNEINTVFTRAINRQSTYRDFALPINCVVLMDEAGLPEESLESLKSLHYHLDQQDVSFVAITNHILDAAKSNRAVSLVVPEPSKKDLIQLSQDYFCDMYNAETSLPQATLAVQSVVSDLVESQAQIFPLLSPEAVDYARLSSNELIGHCCQGYYELMNLDSAERELQYPFHKIFGLRDFIYFLGYLRRKLLQELKSVQSPKLTKALLLEGLERNFNGTNSEDFHYICRKFLKATFQDQDEMQPEFRSVTAILRNSLLETPVNISGHGEVRYKLIIDPSEDSSLIRYMFTFGILRMENTRVHMCSTLGDSHLEKINTLAAIRHSAVEGHTVILSQIDSIQESFYDLFNQRFRCIKNPVTNEHQYYANVAIGAHSKPCRVDPDFQCIVLLKESELSATPAPFLNRFEKYRITYNSLIEECMTNLPPTMRIILETAVDKVSEFVQVIEAPQSLYGYRKETIPSLLLKLLPPPQHVIKPLQKRTPVVSVSHQVSILDTILYNLKLSFGFHIPQMSDKELKSDAKYLFDLVQSEIQHSSLVELNISTSTVIETFKILISIPDSSIAQDGIEFTDDTGLIFRLLVQWFIHYLCKSLMQLMTPEALALLHTRIPESYSWSYLLVQEHFSLKCLLSHYCELQETSGRTDTYAINKVLCFSRSTPKFPHYYSRETNTDANMAFFLEKAVFRDVNQLVVMKLSVSTSQRNIREILKKFSLSPDDRVLLLTVNALQISHDAINHLRILMDEAETLSLGKKKLFVLLLHFSDVAFGRLSYPSLFLEGWDHHYINFVPTAHPEYIVDTKQWFKHSIFPQPGNLLSSEENMLEVVYNLFPILTSRVGFTAPTAERISDMLKKLLFSNDSHVGKALCRRFLEYWTPQTTAEYLHQAAYSIQKSDSTLWLSDTLQKMFKSKFFDYLIYMVSKIHADCNILHLSERNHLDTMMKLFVDIILTYPCPKLSQLKLNSMLGSIPPTVFCEHKLPFFGLLSKLVDDEIDHCKELGNLFGPAKADHDHDEIHEEGNVMEFQLVDEAQKRLCQVVEIQDNSCLAVAINRLAESDELWYIYFSDFAREKLHVGGETSDTIIKSLSQWHWQKVHQISKQGVINCTVAKLVSLHVSVQHLSKVISILRPIAKLEKIAQQISSEAIIKFPQLEPEGSIFEKPEDICLCVVSSLFQPLVQTLIGQTSVEPLKALAGSWNAVYQMMISIPLFKKWIYEHQSSQTEAKFNLMHTMYLVYSFDPSDEECRDTSNVIFGTLYNRYFEPEKHEIKTECPHLQQLADVVLGTLLRKRDTKHIVYVTEGLLEHCFSEYRKQYHPKDIQWFLELANQQVWEEIYATNSTARGNLLDVLKFEISEKHVPSGSIPLNVFKFYLVRILSRSKGVSHRHSVVVPWNNEARLTVGEVLVTAHQSFDPPGSYIPPFYANYYTQCKQKMLMQQPLAHLYFYTTLEYVTPFFHKKKLSGMLEFVDAIEKECQGSEEGHERVILLIEKQALVQTIIRESARALATSKGREAIVVLKDDLNHLFDDEEMGGSRADGKPSGHGVALAMHTVWQMKSFEKFLHLPGGNILMDIKCLKPFFGSEVERRNLATCHLFPFMLPDAVQSQDTIVLANLYQQLCKCMCDVHNSNGASTKAKIQALLRFTEKKLHDHLPISSHIKGEKAACTRLFLWLCTYHEFYKKNIKSDELVNAMKERKMAELLGGEQYAQLIQCFLNPDLMVAGRECVAKSFPHVSRHEPDPLYALFHTSDLNHPNSSDIELRHAIANVVAAVLGSPERTTHLWWHLFSPDELANTYMTGFLFDAPVSREKCTFYNYGVQLKSSGIYAKHSYHKHATRGTLSLHSLYLLLWMNFSAFCIGLITRPNTEKQLRMLLSDELPVRSYCVSQVHSLWSFMRNNLLALDEELAFLIQRCSNSLLQKSLVIKGSSHGRFDTKDKLNVYEQWWHTQIFMPSKQEMNEQFLVHSGLCNHKSFQDIRLMAIHNPKFPTENEFLQHILGFADEQDPCIQLLLQFALEYPRLEIASSLLPELVELYWWLHTDLAHMISRDTAQKTTVKQLMAHLKKYYHNDDEKQKKIRLFNSVKDHFNQYAHTTGVIPDDDNALLNPRVFKIEDNTLVIQLLSVPLQTDQKSNDQLYKVIMELVKTHNHIMELLSKVAASCSHEPLCCHVIADTNKVYLPEVSENTSFVENFSKIYQQSKYLQLIRRRCVTPHIGKEDHTPATLPQFDLHWLLQDIVATFLSGKPQIHSPSTQHIPYCFQVPPNRTRAHLSDCSLHTSQGLYEHCREKFDINTVVKHCTYAEHRLNKGNVLDSLISKSLTVDLMKKQFKNAAQELANINHKLPQEYKQSLSDGHLKTLEYRFHNEPLETYDEVVTGLTTSAQYLINFLHRSDDILMRLDTLQNFLCEVYHRGEPSAAFKMAGFTNLSAHQLSCFLDMKLQNVYHALQVFVQWIEDGYYDFRSLPYATKSHLCAEDEQKLQHLQEQDYHGTPMELLKDLKHITVMLNHIEPNIVKIVSNNPQEPIVNHLSVQTGAKVECALVGFIPESVRVHHYVAFRVALRRLTLEVERLLPPNQRREEEHFTKFEEFVTDLWKKQMGHVQRVPGGSFRGEESTQVVSKEVSGYCTDDNYLDEYSEPEDESFVTTSWHPSEEDSGGDEWVEDDPPRITTHHCGVKNAVPDKLVTFTIQATGLEPLNYQWKHKTGDGNEVERIPGANSSILTIPKVKKSDEGSYHCIVSNCAGSETSKFATVTLTVADPPRITTHPCGIQDAVPGNQVAFTIQATGTEPLNYQWKHKTGDGNEVERIPGANSSTLTIPKVKKSDEGSYHCIVSNCAGSETSKFATLTLADTPRITTHPCGIQDAVPGNQVAFTIQATGTEPLNYQWKHKTGDGNEVERIPGANSSTLTIPKVKKSDEGSYHCIVSNCAGSETSKFATLTLADPPRITTHPCGIQDAVPGNQVAFSIQATGAEQLNYQWKHKTGDGNKVERIPGANSSTLTIPKVKESDEGSYHCIVSNCAGSETSKFATLTVADPPRITTHPCGIQDAVPGNQVAFSIQATGTEPLNYQWKHKTGDGDEVERIPGANSSTLTIPKVKKSDEGSYHCIVSNCAGSETSKFATLTVDGGWWRILKIIGCILIIALLALVFLWVSRNAVCHSISKTQELEMAVAEIGNWESLCENLEVPKEVMNSLHFSTEHHQRKKRECLQAYIDLGEACWEEVVKVVANHPFHNKRLAKKIASKYGVKDEL